MSETGKTFADQLAEDIHNHDYDPDAETFDVEGAARRIEAAMARSRDAEIADLENRLSDFEDIDMVCDFANEHVGLLMTDLDDLKKRLAGLVEKWRKTHLDISEKEDSIYEACADDVEAALGEEEGHGKA